MDHFQHLQTRSTNSPPPLQTKLDMNPTLIFSWFCTIFSIVVILIRTFGRWVRTEKLFREDKITLWSIIPLLIRMAFVHVVLIWGTNNTTTFGLTEDELRHRSIGSRMVLASRIFYALYIWVAKVTVLEFVQKTIGTTWTKFYEKGARIIYIFLGLTLLAVIISTLAECRSITHYWQVVPDPGPACRTGAAQLITMGVCDIITDVVLIVFPIPLVIMSKMPIIKKTSLVFLFLLSLILIAITAYRMPSTVDRHYSQQYRSLLASLEILAATCVSNVLIIGSFLRDKGVKKVKFRAGSIAEYDEEIDGNDLSRPATRVHKPSITQRHWGSDEDLVRDLGLTVSRELRHDSIAQNAALLAPMGSTLPTCIEVVQPTINPQGRGLIDPSWTFRKGSAHVPRKRRGSTASTDSSTSTNLKMQELRTPYSDLEPPSPSAEVSSSQKKMGFFDVGSLVDTSTSEQSSIEYSRRLSQQHTSTPVTKSRANFLVDIGGLLGSSSKDDDEISPVLPSRSGFNNLPILEESSLGNKDRGKLVAESKQSVGRGSLQPISRDASGPDALNISDVGGLL